MGNDVSNVRRDILLFLILAAVFAFIVLMIAVPIVSNYSAKSAQSGRLNYILFSPIILLALLVSTFWYLRPIAKLANMLKAGQPISADVAQRARTLAFTVPIRFLYIPTLLVLGVGTISDVFGVFFFVDYSFIQHYPGTILATIAAACMSLVISTVSRQILTPVLLVTSELAENVGPRFDISRRQFVNTLLLTFIAIAFLGLLGYNQIVQSAREGLRAKYGLLGESIAEDFTIYLGNDALLIYVEALSAGEGGYAFVVDAQGELLTDVPPGYQDLYVDPDVVIPHLVRDTEKLVELQAGEIVLLPLNRPNQDWWLGFIYRVNPLSIPLVQRTLFILAVFVLGMFAFVFVINHYVAEDLTRDIVYVTRRLTRLAQESVDFAQVSVLSLDEVGDLIVAFDTLQAKVQAQTLALVEEKSRLDAILQNIADGLIVTDEHGVIMLVNSAFEGLYGRSSDILLGRPLVEAVPQKEFCRLIADAQADCKATFMAEIPLPDQRTLKASSAAIQVGEYMFGVVTVLRDITHEKEVDRLKTDFISTVSHELRTPLTSVLGFAKLVKKTFEKDMAPKISAQDAKARRTARRINDNLGIIVSEGERLTRLINDVLDIAKMEAGKIEWHDHPFDLSVLMSQALSSMRALAQARGLALHADVPPEGSFPALAADPDRIQQVLLNLLSNAIKFTLQGQVTVSARMLERGERVHGWQAPPESLGGMLLTVSDTGIGIPGRELPRLFQRFFQVGDTLRNKPKGTGLGLAISREIVLHYGGEIWAESTVGEGSTFYFTLPFMLTKAEPDQVLPVVSEIRRRVSGVLAASAEPATLLIVDDDPGIRSLLVQELSGAGYGTLEAANGAEALSLARRYRPDLILLDVMMPDISGFDVTRVLKADPSTALIPILILSIIQDRQRGLALGADDYLTKPVETDRLLETISALLAQKPERLTAMVAGQDRSALELITVVLRQQGFEVVEAFDPRGAIAAAQEIKPDLVILDEMISRLNNAEVLRALRFQDVSHAYMVVVLSGKAEEPSA